MSIKENIPIGNYIGINKHERILLANHFRFILFYNQDKLVIFDFYLLINYQIGAQIGFVDSDFADITQPMVASIGFTYSVEWIETDIENVISTSYDSFYPDDSHWLSFINALVIVTINYTLSYQ